MQAGAALELDSALIDASRRGDRTAFAQIIERYQRAVYAVAFSSLRDRALADDITQDTFVTAWRRLDELRDPSRLPAWLCGIARNLGRDARRRLRRETLGDADVAIDAHTPYEAMSDVETERLVAVALGQVPDTYREPLVLYYYEERSVDDVARSLGITAATTNKRLSRGRQFLAERVATLVERGLTRRGARPGLAASVLAIIAVTAPASHVDASPAPVKGSNMHKLAIAAVVTAAVGGGGVLVATTTQGDAHARPASSSGERTRTTAPHADHASTARTAGRGAPPSVPASTWTGANAASQNDCAAVARHMTELEADTTHGPDQRPDDATCAKCVEHYTAQCLREAWTVERRNCSLAAPDLINAFLCAGTVPRAPSPPANIPNELSCAVLGPHLGAMAHAAGMYTYVPDLPKQIESACETGAWTLALRQCFVAAATVDAAQACLQ